MQDVTPCESCRIASPSSAGMKELASQLLLMLFLARRALWLLVAASVVPSSPILVTPMKEALSSSEDTILQHIPSSKY
jgi:hypothetical protein